MSDSINRVLSELPMAIWNTFSFCALAAWYDDKLDSILFSSEMQSCWSIPVMLNTSWSSNGSQSWTQRSDSEPNPEAARTSSDPQVMS